MKPNRVALLIDAISENFMNALPGRPWSPSTVQNNDGKIVAVTHCNQFVTGVAHALDYSAFWPSTESNPMTANEMHDFMISSSDWMSVRWDVAQAHANDGALVIAAQLGDPHGHVCIVRPGIAVPSGHYGHPAPRCANVGGTVFIDQNMAYAFHEEPNYFVLNSTLG